MCINSYIKHFYLISNVQLFFDDCGYLKLVLLLILMMQDITDKSHSSYAWNYILFMCYVLHIESPLLNLPLGLDRSGLKIEIVLISG
jgi:hypothetical protein